MKSYNVYEDIAKRTNGDIYVGVVGPVRCGKSTFISKFVNTLVLPNIKDEFSKTRAIDELPQSADGKAIMTTQPRFVPNEAVEIRVKDSVDLKVRLVDCVGYVVAGATGHTDGSKPRLVKTPWSDTPMPFEQAAEIGTKKVITEHSTIAVAVTCDGSFTDIERQSYIQAEERIVKELKATKKPFVLVLNTVKPQHPDTLNLLDTLKAKYEVPVLAMDIANLNTENIDEVFEGILGEFPLTSLQVKMPQWMQALPFDDEIIKEVVLEAKNLIGNVGKIGEIDTARVAFESSGSFEPLSISQIRMGEGVVSIEVVPKPDLFYKVLSKQCGQEILSDFHLVSFLKKLSHAKVEYDKIKDALLQVEEHGYGVVSPRLDEMKLEEPEIVKQGSRYGVRLKASAPSLHMMKVDVETEISPIVGTEQQSEDIVRFLLKEFESDPKGLWETNMFGKSLHTLVNEGLNNKLVQMPVEAQKKMRRTLGRIVNEGKGGIICILL
ncbi:MAG: stage IV sporulation protein A [Christensenellaceae bacterium]|jgi:stage IV sporulation protein A|nr:stage IV sporulation protein A [Christensenellaceae bacterium]